MLHGLRGPQLLALRLTAGIRADGNPDGRDCEEQIDQPAGERLQARPHLATLTDHTEGGLTESPHRIAEQPNRDQPHQHHPTGVFRQNLQRPLLVGLIHVITECKRDRKRADEQVNTGTGRQSCLGQARHRLTSCG
jgi:hypothetical protein